MKQSTSRNPIDSTSVPDFIQAKAYVKSESDFCLGSNLEEAGAVVKALEEKYGGAVKLPDGNTRKSK